MALVGRTRLPWEHGENQCGDACPEHRTQFFVFSLSRSAFTWEGPVLDGFGAFAGLLADPPATGPAPPAAPTTTTTVPRTTTTTHAGTATPGLRPVPLRPSAGEPPDDRRRVRLARPAPPRRRGGLVRAGPRDGPVHQGSCTHTHHFGDETTPVSGGCTAACAPPERPRYGPWDPPPPENTDLEETFRHVYAEAGEYTAFFAYYLGDDCDPSPYRSRGEARVTVTVAPAE